MDISAQLFSSSKIEIRQSSQICGVAINDMIGQLLAKLRRSGRKS
jgi:hypothetical protein